MSISAIQTQKPPKTKIKIVDYFIVYLKNTYNEDVVLNEAFSIIFNKYAKYGDSIFQELVNEISSQKNIKIMDLLREFGAFLRQYY